MAIAPVGSLHAPVVTKTPDEQLQDVQSRVANRSLGGKIASWFKSVGGGSNPSSVALRAAITAKVGGDAQAAQLVLDKFGIKDSTSLSSTKVQNAIDFAGKVAGWQQVPLRDGGAAELFQAMGPRNFASTLAGAEATMAAHGVTRSDVVQPGKPPLTDAEIVALNEYTEQSFYHFNHEIRTGNESALTTAQRMAMESGLDKLKPFTGEVHRGADLPEDGDGAHKKGQIVSDRTFTSTSAAKDQAFAGTHQMVIYSKTGRDISFLSSRPNEKEVLFPPGTQFKVLDREGAMAGYQANGKAFAGNVNLVMREV